MWTLCCKGNGSGGGCGRATMRFAIVVRLRRTKLDVRFTREWFVVSVVVPQADKAVVSVVATKTNTRKQKPLTYCTNELTNERTNKQRNNETNKSFGRSSNWMYVVVEMCCVGVVVGVLLVFVLWWSLLCALLQKFHKRDLWGGHTRSVPMSSTCCRTVQEHWRKTDVTCSHVRCF